MFRKLAASSTEVDMADLVTFSSTATTTKKKQKEETSPKGDLDMDSKDILAALTAKGAEVGELTAKLSAETAKVTELTASNTELTNTVATLTSEKEALEKDKTDLEAQLADAPEGSAVELKTVVDFLDAQLAAAVTASGRKDVKTDEMNASQKVEFIKETGVNLHQLVGSESGASEQELNATQAADAKRRQAAWKAQFSGK